MAVVPRAVRAGAAAALATAALVSCGPSTPIAGRASGSAARAVVWAVGGGPDDGRAAAQVAGLVARGHPDLVLFLGDVYTPDYSAFAAAYGSLARRVAPTPGDEDWAANARTGYLRYWRGVYGYTLPPYYSFEIAGWQVLSLDSETPHDAASAQLAWLRGELRRPGTCRIAFWHRPRYSAAGNGDAPDTAPLWDVLTGHATLVVGGHDHDLQRMRPLGGLTELVSGAGGHGHDVVDPADPRTAFADDANYGALRIVLTPGRADLSFVALDGYVLDVSTVSCTPVAP
jgi:hypothetical protein